MRGSFIRLAIATSLSLVGGCTAPLGTLEGQVFSPITALSVPSQAHFVAGQAIVKWRAGADRASLGVQNLRSHGLGSMELLSLPDSAQGVSAAATSGEKTLEWIAELRQNPAVEFAEPNYYRFAQEVGSSALAPNDALYGKENLPRFTQIGLEGAWRQTVGSSQVVVAVLDDGILWRHNDPANSHPDLSCGRFLTGYDFVSNPANGDGDGRDPDPYASTGEGHGSHVAGIVGACTNNELGVAGVDWNARVLPVRVLGQDGGTDADIVDGLRWAVGLGVSGAPSNPTPAKVINLSLGGFGLSRVFDEAINEATARGAIVVAAAGNDNADATLYSPAGNQKVIAVGATNDKGQRASFSNYGAAVRVMAPGTGILSTAKGTGGQRFGYRRFEGTSMAAPHVSGVVALMAAARPGLSWVEATEYLRLSARAVPHCTGCGSGQVDAQGAVALARSGAAVGGFLTSQRFALQQTQQRVLLRNYGGQTVSFNAAPTKTLRLEPRQGSIAPGATLEAILTVSPPGSPGIYNSALALAPDGGPAAQVLALFQVGSGISNVGKVQVALCQETPLETRLIERQTLEYGGNQYSFRFFTRSLSGDGYYLRAWVDENGDNITEMSSYRRYTAPSSTGVSLVMSAQTWRLNQGGCLAD